MLVKILSLILLVIGLSMPAGDVGTVLRNAPSGGEQFALSSDDGADPGQMFIIEVAHPDLDQGLTPESASGPIRSAVRFEAPAPRLAAPNPYLPQPQRPPSQA